MNIKKSTLAIAIAVSAFAAGIAQAAPLFADVVAIVDESGSMSGEHAWLGGMVSSLDTGLNTAGLPPNQYGLVGFGGGSGHTAGHTHLVGGAQFGNATQFATAAGTSSTSFWFRLWTEHSRSPRQKPLPLLSPTIWKSI